MKITIDDNGTISELDNIKSFKINGFLFICEEYDGHQIIFMISKFLKVSIDTGLVK